MLDRSFKGYIMFAFLFFAFLAFVLFTIVAIPCAIVAAFTKSPVTQRELRQLELHADAMRKYADEGAAKEPARAAFFHAQAKEAADALDVLRRRAAKEADANAKKAAIKWRQWEYQKREGDVAEFRRLGLSRRAAEQAVVMRQEAAAAEAAAWLPSPYPASSYSIAEIEAMKVRRAAAAAEAAASPPRPSGGLTKKI
jgi:hypothetical protein